MLFMDELQPLRLYSGKRKVLIPFNEKDKRHGAAIFLMSSSFIVFCGILLFLV